MFLTENQQKIGSGGFGTITLERGENKYDGEQQQFYALKHNSLNKPFVKATYNELYKLKFLNQVHYNLCPKLIDSYYDKNSLVFKLQLFQYDLRGLQKLRIFDKCKISQYFFVVEKVVSVVHKLHQLNLYHLDLKSANILVDDTGQSVLCDFGLSSFDNHLGTLQTGTLLYEPPEVLFNVKQIPIKNLEAIDLYGLGLIIMEILFSETVYKISLQGDKFENMKLAQLKVYGCNIIKMCKKMYNIQTDQEAKEFILKQISKQNQEIAIKYLQKEQIDFEKLIRTAIILRFKQQIFQSQYKNLLDQFIYKVSKLFSYDPTERKDINDLQIFKCDNQSITTCLPENSALDALVQETDKTYFAKLFNFLPESKVKTNFKFCFEDILRSKSYNTFKCIKSYQSFSDLEKQLQTIIKFQNQK